MCMRKVWIFGILLTLSACLPAATPLHPTATLTPTPSPSLTVEWFPATPTPEVRPTSEVLPPTQAVLLELGEIIFRDDFTTPEEWIVPQTDRGQISIRDGEANIVINQAKSFLVGTRIKPNLTSFYAEITANPVLCAGRDEYGFLFRVFGRNQYYRFAITCNGEVRLDKITAAGGTILYHTPRSASVPVGAPSVSKIAVLADRDQLHLFINGDYQASVSDQQLLAGSFGIYARSSGDSAVTVSFSDLIVRDILPK
jgi:hypothetical protein